MKAHKLEDKGFVPVVLTLENQHEVDAIYSLLNNVVIVEAVGLGGFYKSLHPFINTESANRLHNQIMNMLRGIRT